MVRVRSDDDEESACSNELARCPPPGVRINDCDAYGFKDDTCFAISNVFELCKGNNPASIQF